ATVPWFMGGWLSLSGLIERPFLLWFFALAILLAATWWFAHHSRREIGGVAVVTAAAATLLAIVGGPYLNTTPTYIRGTFAEGWKWIDVHVAQSTNAYTGISLPYPRDGGCLNNRLVYV